MSLLQLEHLSTGYLKYNKVIRSLQNNIHAVVEKGKLISLLGPNGTGKTTLLKTLLGFVPKIKGSVFYDGIPLESISPQTLATKVSAVLTERPDDLYLTAKEIILTGRYPYGTFWENNRAEDLEKVAFSAKTMGIEHLLAHPFHTLSDGEKQRVMIARALAQDTPLILMDEPTSFIDSPGKIELMETLKKITNQGVSILATLHDVELAIHYSDYLWVMDKKGGFEEGLPGQLVVNGGINRAFDTQEVTFDREKIKFIPIEKNKKT